MSEWTARRLDDLPDGTVIAWEEFGITVHAAIEDDSGWVIGGDRIRDRQNILIWASPGSIRVVSVPVDALLSGEAILAAAKAAEEARGWPWYGLATHHQQVALAAAAVAVRAAIAHITGEES